MHLHKHKYSCSYNGKIYWNEKIVSIHSNYDAKVIEYFEFGNVSEIYFSSMIDSSFPSVSIIYVSNKKNYFAKGCIKYLCYVANKKIPVENSKGIYESLIV